MKVFLFTILFLLPLSVFGQGKTHYGIKDVKAFREGRDKEFRSHTESPLLEEDFSKFKGLNYFPTDKKYRVKAKFIKTPDEKFFLMPTSSGKNVKYVKTGIYIFKLDGKEHTLTAYQSEAAQTNPEWKEKYGHAFFIPFKDLTNSAETYSVGRYLYLKIPEGEDTEIDFNLTFNPSCAYGSDRYSCPIPPKENFLRAKIRAGEKTYEYTGIKTK